MVDTKWCQARIGLALALIGLGLTGAVFAEPTGFSPAPAYDGTTSADPRGSPLYLDLMKRSLTNWLYHSGNMDQLIDGRSHPGRACTMIGLKPLDNLQRTIEDVIARGVPGDLIEAGAWRGEQYGKKSEDRHCAAHGQILRTLFTFR